jgi:hypothetical protein
MVTAEAARVAWQHGAVTGGEGSGDGAVVHIRSNGERLVFVIGGVVGGLVLVVSAARGEPLMGLFAAICPVMVLDGLRAEIVVDRKRGTVSSQRAFRRWSGRVEDVESVGVPGRGPIVLVLRPGDRKIGHGRWLGQIRTGVYADRRGRRGRAVQLADALGVDVVSASRFVRRDDEYSEDDPIRGVTTDLFRSRSGIFMFVVVALSLSILAVILVALVTGT